MSKETIAEEVLRLLSPIPEDEFIVLRLTDGESKCCVIGHYERLMSRNPSDYSIVNCGMKNCVQNRLIQASSEFLFEKFGTYTNNIVTVNNAETKYYPQPIIKDRVIAVLKDMIKAGY